MESANRRSRGERLALSSARVGEDPFRCRKLPVKLPATVKRAERAEPAEAVDDRASCNFRKREGGREEEEEEEEEVGRPGATTH